MAPHSSILAQRIPQTEEPGGLQSMTGSPWLQSMDHSPVHRLQSQRTGQDWATEHTHTHTHTHIHTVVVYWQCLKTYHNKEGWNCFFVNNGQKAKDGGFVSPCQRHPSGICWWEKERLTAKSFILVAIGDWTTESSAGCLRLLRVLLSLRC